MLAQPAYAAVAAPLSVPDDPDPFVNVFGAARIASVHPQTIRRAFRDKRLRGTKVNGAKNLRFRRSWVVAWLEKSAIGG